MISTTLDNLKSLPIITVNATNQSGQTILLGSSKSPTKIDKAQLFDIQIWTISELALVLDCCKGTIYNKVSRNEIPFHKKGRKGRLYFIPSEILEWIKREEFQ